MAVRSGTPPALGWRLATASVAALAACLPTALIGLTAVVLLQQPDAPSDTWTVLLPTVAAAGVLWATVAVMVWPTRVGTAVCSVLVAVLAVVTAVAALAVALPEIRDPPLKGGGMATSVGVAGGVVTLLLLAVAAGALVVRARLPRTPSADPTTRRAGPGRTGPPPAGPR